MGGSRCALEGCLRLEIEVIEDGVNGIRRVNDESGFEIPGFVNISGIRVDWEEANVMPFTNNDIGEQRYWVRLHFHQCIWRQLGGWQAQLKDWYQRTMQTHELMLKDGCKLPLGYSIAEYDDPLWGSTCLHQCALGDSMDEKMGDIERIVHHSQLHVRQIAA